MTTTISRVRQSLGDNRELALIYGILLVVFGAGLLLSPDFRTTENLFNVLRQAVPLGIIAVGQTIIILAGGIDLSVGATISLVAVYTTGLMRGQEGVGAIVFVLPVVIGMALLVGLCNAWVSTALRVPPFIATLGTGAIVQGLVLLYTKSPIGNIPDEWEYFAEGMIGPIPFPVIFLIVLVLLTHIMLTRTVIGRYVIATGGSEVVARWSGIQTQRTLLFAFLFCSFTAALCGLFLTSRMGVGDPQVGGLSYDRYDLDSIAAVLIGGTRLGGGKGSVLGTLAGVLILLMLNNIFNLIGVTTYYQWIIKGIIILFAVAVYAVNRRTA